jgi:hypothetical protein
MGDNDEVSKMIGMHVYVCHLRLPMLSFMNRRVRRGRGLLAVPSNVKDFNHLDKEYLDSSHLDKEYLDSSHLDKEYLDSSHLDKEYLDSSHLATSQIGPTSSMDYNQQHHTNRSASKVKGYQHLPTCKQEAGRFIIIMLTMHLWR